MSASHHLREARVAEPRPQRPPPVASGMAALMSPDPRERGHRTVEVAGIEPVGKRWDVLTHGADLRERWGHLRFRRLGSPACVDGVNDDLGARQCPEQAVMPKSAWRPSKARCGSM